MQGSSPRITQEHGQAMIQVVISILVIIGFVALAIDFGRVYSERRNMQNAADAAALAGARELCLGNSAADAKAKAVDFLKKNGVAAGDIEGNDVLVTGNMVDTIARHKSFSPVLGQILAWSATDVVATAQAACGAATSACGLWPVAFSEGIWKDLYSPAGETCKPTKIAVWHDEEKKPLCVKDGKEQYNLCKCYDCDTNDDGKDDFMIVSSLGRAWLDLSESVPKPFQGDCIKSGCGASELRCLLENNSSIKINLPMCILGDSGVKAGVKEGVEARAGDTVAIPLYDSTGCSGPGCSGDHFNVTSLGCIDVAPDTENAPWDQNFEVNLIGSTKPGDRLKGKVVWANVDCANKCMTACGTTDGTPPEPWQVKAVSLIK